VFAVLRQRDFSLLWVAGLVSLTGDWMLLVALPVSVYALTGSALATAGVLVANRLPALLLGSVAGVFVDRWDRRRTMIVANLVRAPLLLPLLAVDSAERVWIVYAVAACIATGNQFFRPAENALLPRLVGEDRLVPANALNALNDNLSRLIGPALGGVVVATFGLGGVAVADAASFLIAAALIAAIDGPGRPVPADALVEETADAAGAFAKVWREWLAGLRVVAGSRVLKVVFGVVAIASIGEGVMGTALWVFIDQALNGGPREAGWLLSAQAVGGMIGAALVGSRFGTRSPVALLGWGAIGIGLCDLVLFNYPAFAPVLWPALLLFAVAGLPATAFGTGFTSAIQLEAEDAFRGRVFGAMNALSALLMIVGAGIAGVATERFGPVAVLTIDALAYIAGGVVALWTLTGVAAARRRRAVDAG
jgi:MFS family permease